MNVAANLNLSQLDSLIAGVNDKQQVFALAVALTRTARDVKAKQREQLNATFDRPTPYTLNSLYVKTATKQDLSARVWFKDARAASKGGAASTYLAPQVVGGGREVKAFERALTNAGVLPAGHQVMPASALARDAYGNVPRGVLSRILQALKAPRTSRAPRGSGANVGYFVPKPGGKLHPGVYSKHAFAGGTAIKPVLLFVSQANYAARYDFAALTQATVDEVFAKHFEDALAQAMATAK